MSRLPSLVLLLLAGLADVAFSKEAHAASCAAEDQPGANCRERGSVLLQVASDSNLLKNRVGRTAKSRAGASTRERDAETLNDVLSSMAEDAETEDAEMDMHGTEIEDSAASTEAQKSSRALTDSGVSLLEASATESSPHAKKAAAAKASPTAKKAAAAKSAPTAKKVAAEKSAPNAKKVAAAAKLAPTAKKVAAAKSAPTAKKAAAAKASPTAKKATAAKSAPNAKTAIAAKASSHARKAAALVSATHRTHVPADEESNENEDEDNTDAESNTADNAEAEESADAEGADDEENQDTAEDDAAQNEDEDDAAADEEDAAANEEGGEAEGADDEESPDTDEELALADVDEEDGAADEEDAEGEEDVSADEDEEDAAADEEDAADEENDNDPDDEEDEDLSMVAVNDVMVAEREGLDQRGYSEVAMARSNRRMERFIERVVDEMSLDIVDVGGLKGMVPYYSGQKTKQSFVALRKELRTASRTKGGWLEKRKRHGKILLQTDVTEHKKHEASLSLLGMASTRASRAAHKVPDLAVALFGSRTLVLVCTLTLVALLFCLDEKKRTGKGRRWEDPLDMSPMPPPSKEDPIVAASLKLLRSSKSEELKSLGHTP